MPLCDSNQVSDAFEKGRSALRGGRGVLFVRSAVFGGAGCWNHWTEAWGVGDVSVGRFALGWHVASLQTSWVELECIVRC